MSEEFKSRQTPGKRGDHGQFYKEVKFFVQKEREESSRAEKGTDQRLEKWALRHGEGDGHQEGHVLCGVPDHLQLSHPELRIPNPRSPIPEGAAAALLLRSAPHSSHSLCAIKEK